MFRFTEIVQMLYFVYLLIAIFGDFENSMLISDNKITIRADNVTKFISSSLMIENEYAVSDFNVTKQSSRVILVAYTKFVQPYIVNIC